MNLIDTELTDVLETKRRRSVPKTMHIGSGILNMRTVKPSVLGFFGPPDRLMY